MFINGSRNSFGVEEKVNAAAVPFPRKRESFLEEKKVLHLFYGNCPAVYDEISRLDLPPIL
jgi:hypothetical protein